jgi:hypothetical protein
MSGSLMARRWDFEIAVVREEIQGPATLDHGVKHGLRASHLRMREATSSSEIDLDRQPPGGSVEIDAAHEPPIAHTRCAFEQLAMHDLPSSCLCKKTGQYRPLEIQQRQTKRER